MLNNIFLSIGWIVVMVIALCELILFFWLLKRYLYSKKLICVDMAVLTLGLFFYSVVLSIGRFVEVGQMLQMLSKVSLIVRAVVIPLILVICAYALELSDSMKRTFWIAAIICMIAGVTAAVLTQLEPAKVTGVVFYKAARTTAKWVDLINTYLPLGILAIGTICALVMIFKVRSGWFFLGIGGNLALRVAGMIFGFENQMILIGLFGEVLMILCFWLYSRKLKKAYL